MEDSPEPGHDATVRPSRARPRRRRYVIGLLLLTAAGAWIYFEYFFHPEVQATLKGHSASIHCVAFAPNGKTAATASSDGTARLWDIASCKERAVLRGHTDSVWRVAFSPDSSLVATASQDGSAKVWDATTGEQRANLLGHGKTHRKDHVVGVEHVAFSHDSRILVSVTDYWSSDEGLRRWDLASGKQLGTLGADDDRVEALAVARNGRLLAAKSHDGLLRVWDLVEGKELRRFGKEDYGPYCVAITPDGKTVASNKGSHGIKVWDVATGQELACLTSNHGWPLASIALSPDGKVVAAAVVGGMLEFWDVDTGRLLRTVRHVTDRAIAISPDGTTLATAGEDWVLRLWNMKKLSVRQLKLWN